MYKLSSKISCKLNTCTHFPVLPYLWFAQITSPNPDLLCSERSLTSYSIIKRIYCFLMGNLKGEIIQKCHLLWIKDKGNWRNCYSLCIVMQRKAFITWNITHLQQSWPQLWAMPTVAGRNLRELAYFCCAASLAASFRYSISFGFF